MLFFKFFHVYLNLKKTKKSIFLFITAALPLILGKCPSTGTRTNAGTTKRIYGKNKKNSHY